MTGSGRGVPRDSLVAPVYCLVYALVTNGTHGWHKSSLKEFGPAEWLSIGAAGESKMNYRKYLKSRDL